MLESQSCVFVVHAVIFHVRDGVSRRYVFVVQDVELMHAKSLFSIRRTSSLSYPGVTCFCCVARSDRPACCSLISRVVRFVCGGVQP